MRISSIRHLPMSEKWPKSVNQRNYQLHKVFHIVERLIRRWQRSIDEEIYRFDVHIEKNNNSLFRYFGKVQQFHRDSSIVVMVANIWECIVLNFDNKFVPLKEFVQQLFHVHIAMKWLWLFLRIHCHISLLVVKTFDYNRSMMTMTLSMKEVNDWFCLWIFSFYSHCFSSMISMNEKRNEDQTFLFKKRFHVEK